MDYRKNDIPLFRLILSIIIPSLFIFCNTQNDNSDWQNVAKFDKDKDFFVYKSKVKYAQRFKIKYFKNYKVITIITPLVNKVEKFNYILVQKNTPPPEGYEDSYLIEIPVKKVVCLSSSHLGMVDKIGALESLVGVSSFNYYFNNPSIKQMINSNQLAEVGNMESLNMEEIMSINPDLVFAFGSRNPSDFHYNKLTSAGITVAITAENLERLPLGRAEWIKFIAAFYNLEDIAERHFNFIENEYLKLKKNVIGIKNRPTVLVGRNWGGVWRLPGGNRYLANFIQDAGANYLFGDDTTAISMRLNFESVINIGRNADFWIHTGNWEYIEECLKDDERYKHFLSVQNKQLYNNNARINLKGGNDFYESGIVNPQIILMDLISIFHPEILPNHNLVYYKKLGTEKP